MLLVLRITVNIWAEIPTKWWPRDADMKCNLSARLVIYWFALLDMDHFLALWLQPQIWPCIVCLWFIFYRTL